MKKGFNYFNPYAAVGIGIIFISFGSIFAKMSTAPSLVIATYRIFFAVLLLTPFCLLRNWQELKALQRKEICWMLISGCLLALHFATWISSLKYISVGNSVVLVALQPVFVALGSYFFLGEKLALKPMIAGLVAMLGTLILGFGDIQMGENALWGDTLAILGAMFAALYWMVGRAVRQRVSVTTYTYVVYLACAAVLFLMTISQGIALTGYSLHNWFLFLGLALIPTIGGHNVFNWALGYVPAIVISLSILGEAVGATILAYFFFQEVPTINYLIGDIIILVGIYFFITTQGKESKVKEK